MLIQYGNVHVCMYVYICVYESEPFQNYTHLFTGTFKMDTSPPELCTNSARISNNSACPNEQRKSLFCKEILSFIVELEQGQSTSITVGDHVIFVLIVLLLTLMQSKR